MTESHSTRAHARLAPSASSRWMACPGSVALSEGLREAPSPFANEGTAAHMLAQRCLLDGEIASAWRGYIIDIRDAEFWHAWGSVAPDGLYTFEVDAEMVDGVQLYLDVVREIIAQTEEYEVEHRLDNSDLVPGIHGTGDFTAYLEDARRLVVCDFKYGKGVAVDAHSNKQLLTYALGLAKRYHNRGVDEVELTIVQPRAPHRDGPVRKWVTDVVTLYEHAIALQDAATRIAKPDAPRIPGSHCKFCKAAAICPELGDEVFDIVGAERNILGVLEVTDPTKYDRHRLAQWWRDRDIVLAWCKSVEKFAHAEAMAGVELPGLKLVRKEKHRAWKNEDEASIELYVLGLKKEAIFEPEKMRTPAQVEKELPAKQRKAIMEALAEKPKTAETVLAEIDDPRPAVDPGAPSGFEAVEIENR